MRTRSILALAALICAVPAFAVPVEFYDEAGNLCTDCSVLVLGPNGEVQKLGPASNGVYEVDAVPGAKLTVQVNDPAKSYDPQALVVPVDVQENIHMTLRTFTTCADPSGAVDPGGTVSGDTTGAPASPEAGTFCGTTVTQPPTGDWWEVTVPVGGGDRSLTASTCNQASYDTKLSVYCQDCDALTCIGGNDDGPGCSGFSSSFTWCAQEGATYRVFVHGFLGATGAYNLSIIDNAPCASSDECLPPPTVGACCFDNCDVLNGQEQFIIDECGEFTCDELTADECAAAGGNYLGDDIPCVELGEVPVVYTATPNAPIPDNDPAGVRTEMVVADDFSIGDLNVDLFINHTWVGDLAIFVENKATGTVVQLWGRNCGGPSAGLDFLSDDEGTQGFCGPTGGYTTGSIIPLGPSGYGTGGLLEDFDGQSTQGTWSLSADDNYTADTGVIVEWSLIFVTGVANCPQDCIAGGDGDGDGDGDEDEDEDGMDPNVLFATSQNQSNNSGLLDLNINNNPTESQNTTSGARSGRSAGKASVR